ncbi:MAG: glucosyltransferase domain-containing protein [Alphaproteobacteria bacterium]|nr:glucosyltransferase domain-containing protein [Alphaproteobacteria bacterium]
MNYLKIEQKLIDWYKNIPDTIKKSVLYSFLLINLAFLFHTINFMFGDHDWNYVKQATSWKEGAFEGRPLHFVLQRVFFGGQVLPILNNVFSFFALSLSSVMLAKYWKIPASTLNYTLFATFIAVMPYTLVWLFYAKDALINLCIPLIIMSSLFLAKSKKTSKTELIFINLLSIFLMFFALSSYVASINMVGVCVIGAILRDYLKEDKKLVSIIKEYISTAINTILSLALFKLYLMVFPTDASYNTKIIPLDFVIDKFFITIEAMFGQFTVILPFMDYKYKIILLAMVCFSLVVLLTKAPIKKYVSILGLLFLVVFSSKFAYFISDARGEILAEMEELAYVPRLDFYGIVYVYALSLSFILTLKSGIFRKTGIILAAIITFMSIVRDAYALKTWKLGFDAEMKIHERVVSRLEEHPQFILGRNYRVFQIGSISLRKNFYKKQYGEKIGLDTLETSFTPNYMSFLVYNFYYPQNLFHHNVQEYALSPRGRDFILHQAKPWPSEDSIYIDGDIVIIVLTQEGLMKSISKIKNNILR